MKKVPNSMQDKMDSMKQPTSTPIFDKEKGIMILKDKLPKGIDLVGWTPKPDPKTMFIAKEAGSFQSYGREYIYNPGDLIVWKWKAKKGVGVKVDKETRQLTGVKKDGNGNLFDQEGNLINASGNQINADGEEIKEKVPIYSIDKDVFKKNFQITEQNGDDIIAIKTVKQPGILIKDLNQETMNFFEKHLNPEWINKIKQDRKEHGLEYKGLFRKSTDENGKEILEVATEESYHKISDNYMLFFSFNKETGCFEDFYPLSSEERFQQLYTPKKPTKYLRKKRK